jgi:hypothetical protein
LELLLNLCWLLLIAPAFCVWLRQRRHSKSLQLGFALACLMVMLFPVISATDDMHAMRQEMKESTPCKQTLKKANRSSGARDLSAPAAQPNATLQAPPCTEVCGRVRTAQSSVPLTAWANISPCRRHLPPSVKRTVPLCCGAFSLNTPPEFLCDS